MTAAVAAPSTCGSIPARRRSATSASGTTSGRRRAAAASGSRRHGAAGEDLILDVPPGTAIYDDATGALLADLVASGQAAMVARGGRGGLGNKHFATSTHQAPRHAQKGEPGEERWLRLELRLIADIGLVGLPNAGKSTLLAALTAATPKIADYPFTTLEPNLGVMDLGDDDPRLPTIADVPGLIEGASEGAGLGHAFLRHVERTRVLVHVVDGAGRDPEWDHEVIRDELAAHDPALLEKPLLVVFNKLDLPAAAEAWPAFRGRAAAGRPGRRRHRRGGRVAGSPSSAPPSPRSCRAPRRWPSRPSRRASSSTASRACGDGFTVDLDADGVIRVRGRRIERLAAQTNFEVEESAERFQRDLVRLGIDAELRRAGIASGDTVRFGDVELEWEADAWAVER